MAPKQTLSQGLINQLVPRSSLGRDFTTKLNQLRGDQQEALNILGFKDFWKYLVEVLRYLIVS